MAIIKLVEKITRVPRTKDHVFTLECGHTVRVRGDVSEWMGRAVQCLKCEAEAMAERVE